MALRGERIGTAYVRILADGSRLDKSVEREMSKADREMQSQGAQHSALYWDGFNEETEDQKKTTDKSIFDAIHQGGGKYDREGRGISENLINGIRQGMKDLHGEEIGDRIADDILEGLQRGTIRRGGLVKIFEDQRTLVTKATQSIMRDEQKLASEHQRVIKNAIGNVNDLFRKIDVEQNKVQREFKESQRAVESFTKGVKAGQGDRERMLLNLSRIRLEMKRLGTNTTESDRTIRDLRRRLVLANPMLDRFRAKVDTTSDSIGKAFGRGSRNNFLNFIGSLMRGSFRLLKVVPAVAEVFTDLFRTFKFGFEDAQIAGQSFMKSIGAGMVASIQSLGGAASSGVAGLALLAGALVLVTTTAGVTAAFLSELVGILAAVASSIAFGIVGALAPLAGLIAPIAAAVGGLALAFIGMDDATKKMLKNKIKPFTDTLKDLGGEVRKGLFSDIGHQMKQLNEAFDTKAARDWARGIGRGLSNVIGSFTDFLSSDTFAEWQKAMGPVMERQIGKIGKIATNVFSGLLGVMRALAPITNRFLNWVEGITEEFANWANSKGGREEMREFFRKAADSAKSLGGFLKAVWDFLKPILEAGKETGDSIIDSMARSIEKAANFLSSKEGQEALKNWFEDAKDLAGRLGDVVEAIIHLIDVLDSPKNRKLANAFFGGMAKLINDVADAFAWLGKKTDDTIGFFRTLKRWADKGTKALHDLIFTVKNELGRAWKRFTEEFQKNTERIRGVFGRLGGFLDKTWDRFTESFHRNVERIRNFFSNLGTSIRNAWDNVTSAIRDKWNSAMSRLREGISNAGSFVREKFSDIKEWAADRISDIVGFFQDLPGKVKKAMGDISLSGLGSNLLQQARDIVADIVEIFKGLPSAILNSIDFGSIGSSIKSKIKGSLPSGIDIPGIQTGGIISQPTLAMVGEAGPEAVVPLARPMSQVDPAVRELSAIARGMSSAAGVNVVTTPSGPGVDVGGITIITPTEDPAAVAQETVNRLVASTYF